MVSVATATSVAKQSRSAASLWLQAPSELASFLQSQLLHVLLRLNQVGLRTLLKRAAAGGSIWAFFAFLLGGFYEKPWQLPGVVARVLYTIGITLTEYVARGFKPLFDEWTLPFELVRAVTRCVMSHYGDRMLSAKSAQFIRWQSEVVGSALGYMTCRQHGTTTESFEFNGLEHMWVRAAVSSSPRPHEKTNKSKPKPKRRVVVLYFHGGGYAVLSPRMYIAFGSELQHRIHERLRDKLGPSEDVDVDVLLANYRKIPEHAHPIPPLDALAMYKYLIHEAKVSPHEIIVAGDSAGGGLAMATLLRLRDEDPQLLPVAGFLSCPFVDMEIGGDERKAPYCIIADKAGQSIYKAYHPREGDPSTWGDASPVHCNLSGLPPVYIQGAELDYIVSHSRRLMEKAKSDGVTNWHLEIFHNVPHVFSFFPSAILPSAARGLDAMAEYAATQFARSLENAEGA